MSDTAQLDASPAAGTSQVEASAPPVESSSPPNMGTGAAPSLPAENHTGASADASPASQPPDTAKADQPVDKGNAPPASLTTPKSVASNAQKPPAPAPDEAALRERAEANRWGNERKRLVSEMERLRAEHVDLQQFREETMRKAEQANLKRWDHQHPETSKFDQLLARREIARAQLTRIRQAPVPAGLTPEQTQQWKASQEDIVTSGFNEQERAELAEFDQFQDQSIRGLTTNMPQTIGRIVAPMIKQGVQQALQEMRIQREVQRDMQDPTLKPLLDRFGDQMEEAMNQGVPYDQAIHYTKVYGAYEAALAENARLKQQMGDLSGKASAAQVQQELAKGKASITRDIVPPKSSPFMEARKWARENGHDTDSDAFRKKLRELGG